MGGGEAEVEEFVGLPDFEEFEEIVLADCFELFELFAVLEDFVGLGYLDVDDGGLGFLGLGGVVVGVLEFLLDFVEFAKGVRFYGKWIL